jgi:hypothetical protein
MISGAVVRGRPMVFALLSLPRLRLLRRISVLIDTGADSSVIHPADGRLLGIRYIRDFASSPEHQTIGVGGEAREFIEPCVVFLEHGDGVLDEIPIAIGVAVPTQRNENLPSLLGEDILRFYRFTYQPNIGLVSLQRPEEFGP